MSHRSLYLAAALGLASFQASADELLIVGPVESVLLVARGAPGCIDPADLPPEKKDGISRVIVSNSFSCQEGTIRVDRTFAGKPPGATLVLKTPLGEWCRPLLGVSMRAALIQVNDGGVRSAPLDDDGRFEAKPFTMLLGVPANSLAVDANGRASLDALLARARETLSTPARALGMALRARASKVECGKDERAHVSLVIAPGRDAYLLPAGPRGLPSTNKVRPVLVTTYFTSLPAGTPPNDTPLMKTVPFLDSTVSPRMLATPSPRIVTLPSLLSMVTEVDVLFAQAGATSAQLSAAALQMANRASR